jgi:predicted AlkP superfamily pyrophosphatase or phosphodiesterase
MIKFVNVFILTVFLWGAPVFAESFSNVLIVSIDALHPDALSAKTTPVIYRQMISGAYTLSGTSTDPPLTLISHTAMFTGFGPAESGKSDNNWQPGEPTIAKNTIFNLARSYGFLTGYYYSKEKLGFLVNPAVSDHRFSKDNAVDIAHTFIQKSGNHFVFLHVSGLDEVGPVKGWLSPEYLEELSFIDEMLETLIDTVRQKGDYLIVITSDHAGHGTVHGSNHPDDFKLPFVIVSDRIKTDRFRNIPYRVVDLKPMIENLLATDPGQTSAR